MIIEFGIIDLRDEIAEYERKYRPFPPRSGSVSKPVEPWRTVHPDAYWKRIGAIMRAGEGEFGKSAFLPRIATS